jgi:hypothetical protein
VLHLPQHGGRRITLREPQRVCVRRQIMLFATAERRLGIADRLARCFPDRRDPTRITHKLFRHDPRPHLRHLMWLRGRGRSRFSAHRSRFQARLREAARYGLGLCSQPTLSRLENAPSLKDAIRLTWALVDQWMVSYEREPASITLHIDDTCDVVHGHQHCRCSTRITTNAVSCRSISKPVENLGTVSQAGKLRPDAANPAAV